jgi:Glycine transporter
VETLVLALDLSGTFVFALSGAMAGVRHRLDVFGVVVLSRPLTPNTHQHGVTLSADGGQLLVVGTGPAGSATGPAGLTILDLSTTADKHLPLARPHERVAVSSDGHWGYLSGGYTFADGGWDGLTVIDLWQDTIAAELPVPDRPLDIVALPPRSSSMRPAASWTQ